MASRLIRSAFSAVKTRPTPPLRTILPTATSFTTAPRLHDQPGVPQKTPKETASSILEALPGNSLASKVAILSAGAGLSVAAISNELYVFNEESIIMAATLTVFYSIYRYGGPMYQSWADSTAEKYLSILNSARKDHTDAVKERIENMTDLGNVVQVTRDLFAVSKETARLEADAYELEQKTALAHEAKSVLDSWVRYEGQVKARQQKELAESVIAKINKELENPKVLDQILKQSVADVERIVSQKV